MKPEERRDIHANTLALRLGGAPEFFRQHAMQVVTFLAVAVLAYSVARYWYVVQEQSHLAAMDASLKLRSAVQSLGRLDAVPGMSDTQRASLRAQWTDEAIAAFEVINKEAAESNTALRSQAHLQRGNLYWTLANFGELPGASTRPDLKIRQPKSDLLAAAAVEYQFVIDTYPKESVNKASAMFGLAAVDENLGKLDDARKRYEQISNDETIDQTLRDAARQQAQVVMVLKNRMFVGRYPKPTTTPAGPTGPILFPPEPAPTGSGELQVPSFITPPTMEPTAPAAHSSSPTSPPTAKPPTTRP